MTDQAQRIKKVSGIRLCDLPEERSVFQFDPDVVDQPLAAIGHYEAVLRLISQILPAHKLQQAQPIKQPFSTDRGHRHLPCLQLLQLTPTRTSLQIETPDAQTRAITQVQPVTDFAGTFVALETKQLPLITDGPVAKAVTDGK